jgi:CDP-diglyceride synthetase
MNVALRTIWVFALTVIVFTISVLIDFYWVEFAVSKITFPTILEIIEPIHFFVWLPDIVLYSMVGWLLFFKRSKFFWLFCLLVLAFEVYMIEHGFTEHSALSTRIWVYISYFVPTVSLLIGNQFSEQLTSQGTRPSARTRILRARS